MALQDEVEAIHRLYDIDPEAAHVAEDELVRAYINRRASADDQHAIMLASLVNDTSHNKWSA
jgi:hypothetical protein